MAHQRRLHHAADLRIVVHHQDLPGAHRCCAASAHRQRKVERRPSPRFALHPDPLAVRLHDAFRDRQAHAGALCFEAVAPARGRTCRRCGCARLLRCPGPRSATPITIFPSLHSRGNGDGRPLGRVLQRIIDELLDHLLHEFRIGTAARQVLGNADRRRRAPSAAPQTRPRAAAIRSAAVTGRLSSCSLPASMRAMATTSAAIRFSRSASSLMMVSSSRLASGARAEQAGDRGFDRRERRFDIVRQRIQQRRFQQLALPRRFRMAGFFQRARLFDRERHQVDDGAHASVRRAAGPRSARLPKVRPPKRTGASTQRAAPASMEISSSSAAARRSWSVTGFPLRTGAQDFVRRAVVERRAVAIEHLDDPVAGTRGWSGAAPRPASWPAPARTGARFRCGALRPPRRAAAPVPRAGWRSPPSPETRAARPSSADPEW